MSQPHDRPGHLVDAAEIAGSAKGMGASPHRAFRPAFQPRSLHPGIFMEFTAVSGIFVCDPKLTDQTPGIYWLSGQSLARISMRLATPNLCKMLLT
jgi:hypothetical protein